MLLALFAFALAAQAQQVGGKPPLQAPRVPVVHQVAPRYPVEAKHSGLSGVVRLEAAISESGVPTTLRVVSGHPALGDAAVEAVRQWKFDPTLLDGKPVEVMTHIEVNFTLANDSLAKPVEVAGSAQRAQLTEQPKPTYPPEARAAGIAGKVRLRGIIDDLGNVTRIHVLEGPPELVAAAVESVRQWKYQPPVHEGRPVSVITDIDVNFTLAP